MGDQHRRSALSGFDADREGEKVAFFKGLQGPLVHGDAGVGVHIVPVAGEVLQYRQRTALCHGPVIDEVGRVGRDVCHGGQIHVDPQGFQQGAFLLGVGYHGLHTALGVEGLRRLIFGAAQMGIGADPDNGAALLVHADQQRDAAVFRCGVLIAPEGLDHIVGGLVGKIPAEEHIAPQVIGPDVLQGVFRRTPDKEQLAHLFLQRQGVQNFLDLLGRQLLRRGLRRRFDFLLNRRSGGLRRLGLSAGGSQGQKQQGCKNHETSFHERPPVVMFCSSVP